jgi:hypothetical protein
LIERIGAVAASRDSIPEPSIESIGIEVRVDHGALDIAMAKVMLDRTGIPASISQCTRASSHI